MSKPSTRPLPLDGAMMPHSMRMVVVLPEPFGPRNANTSPSRTSSDRRSTATRSPKLRLNSRASTATTGLVQRLSEAVGAEAEHDYAEGGQCEHLRPQHVQPD